MNCWLSFSLNRGATRKLMKAMGAEQTDGNQRERPAVGEHHRQEDEQEGEIENQRDGGAGDEFADGLDAVQAGDQGAGGAELEVRQGQTQQVAEDLTAEDGINTVAGMQDQGDAGRRKFLLSGIGVEGDAVEAAQAAGQPEHFLRLQPTLRDLHRPACNYEVCSLSGGKYAKSIG